MVYAKSAQVSSLVRDDRGRAEVLECTDSARMDGWMDGWTDVDTLGPRVHGHWYGRTCGVCTDVLTVIYGCTCGVCMAVLGDAELELDGGFLPLNSRLQTAVGA